MKKISVNVYRCHWGFLLAFSSTNLLVFGVYNIFSIGLAGFGWGLILDEIVPMLKVRHRVGYLSFYSDG